MLKEKIESVLDNNPNYSHKRIAEELSLGKKQIIRVMEKYDIRPRRKRKKPKNSKQNEQYKFLPTCSFLSFRCSKITFGLPTLLILNGETALVYAATVIHLFTREIMGLLPNGKNDNFLTQK